MLEIKFKQLLKSFHEGKEENWSEQENLNKIHKSVQK